MRNHHHKTKSGKKARRASLTTLVIALAIPAIAAAAVVSRQSQSIKKAETSAHAGSIQQLSAGSNEQSNIITTDKEKLAEGLKPLINQSTEGLVEVQHADGSVSVNLDDRFQNVTVAKVNRNGSLSQSCVDNPRAAGAFFGIDPKLLEHKPVAPARDNQ